MTDKKEEFMKIKKYFILFLFIFVNVSLSSQPFNGNGDGTVGNPYQIWDNNDFMELNDSVNSSPQFYNWHCDKHFRLMDDIGIITETIGGYDFQGHFHGNGKK